ncbi:MAG: hypothetical protein ACXV1K_05075 [Kineosporiaceae bacterium]
MPARADDVDDASHRDHADLADDSGGNARDSVDATDDTGDDADADDAAGDADEDAGDAELPAPPPLARRLVAAGLALETLLMAFVAVSIAVTSITGSAQDRVGAAVLAVTALALTAGLAAVTVGVHRGARWARSPTLVWQIIQVAVGALNLPVAIGTPLVVLGLAVGYGVLRHDVVPRGDDVTPPR